LSHDGDGKARGYLYSIKQFDFTVALCAVELVFSNSVALSTMSQEKSVYLIEAAQETRVVINIVRAERGDPSVWKEVYEGEKQIASDAKHAKHAKHAKNNQKAATQNECPSHKPRVLLAKSCVSPSY